MVEESASRVGRRVELGIEDKHPIRVHDGVQAVGNDEDGTVGKLSPNRTLNKRISLLGDGSLVLESSSPQSTPKITLEEKDVVAAITTTTVTKKAAKKCLAIAVANFFIKIKNQVCTFTKNIFFVNVVSACFVCVFHLISSCWLCVLHWVK